MKDPQFGIDTELLGVQNATMIEKTLFTTNQGEIPTQRLTGPAS